MAYHAIEWFCRCGTFTSSSDMQCATCRTLMPADIRLGLFDAMGYAGLVPLMALWKDYLPFGWRDSCENRDECARVRTMGREWNERKLLRLLAAFGGHIVDRKIANYRRLRRS